MGMTIDRSLKILKDYYHFHWEYDCGDYGGLGSDEAEALKYAIKTVRKYQKILEIFHRYDKGELTHNMFGLLVGEVLEDGNTT